MIIDEMLVGLGYEFDEKELQDFQQSMDDTTKTIGNFLKVVAGITAAVGVMLKTSATATDQTAKQARQVNVLTSEYDALLHASEITTGSSENVSAALQNLSTRASEAARGVGSGVEAFGMLGIEVTDANGKIKTTDVLLSETSDALNNLEDQGQRLELADKLGLKEVELLLREGSEGIRTLTDEAKALGTITNEDAKVAEDFNDAQSRMFRVLKAVQRSIATGILPHVQKAVDAFTEWLKINRKILKQRFEIFIKILGKVLTGLGKIFSSVFSVISKFIEALGGLDNALKLVLITLGAMAAVKIISGVMMLITAIKGFGAAALIANAKALLIPLAIGAAVVAIGLFIDDLMTFMEGGDSLIGRLLEKFPLLKSAFETLITPLQLLWDLLQMIGKGIGNLVGGVVTTVSEIAEDPGGFATGLLNKLNPFSDDSENNINPFTGAPPLSAGATTNNSSNQNIKQENVFNFPEGTPKETAEEVKKVLEEMVGAGIRNTTSAVDM